MKNLMIYLLAVQITTVSCTYKRQSSRNSVSYLLRKVCVEVTGLKEDNLELKEKVAALEEVVAGLTVEVAGSKQAGKPIYDK